MKNKEIEELLNMLKKEDDYWSEKKHDYPFPDYYSLNREDLHLLLSHIEQLEKRNKQLYDGFMATVEELTDYATKNEQLENNRDKAIKKLNKYRNRKDHFGLWCMEYIDNADVIKILKGDSDESRI